MLLRVLPSEHRINFRALLLNSDALGRAASNGEVTNRNSAGLLQFYAAEVGLKYLLYTVLKIPFKHETKSAVTIESYSHDLPRMISELKVPASRVPPVPQQFYSCIGGYNDGSGGQRMQLFQAHEAWRYGLTVSPADEAVLLAYLAGVVVYLRKEIAP